ncbi:unnamed protein product [marine sediment metagenome]|uniref:Uncharacterized protein n=1 Tax=marine sediment metagenome TaxID=412755 RepID=X1T393_9ZZZZ
MKVEFKFEIGQYVKTIFGDFGIIESAAFDRSGKQYYIQRSGENKWFREDTLSKIKK